MNDLSHSRVESGPGGRSRRAVDVEQAARRLGVSKTAIRDVIATAKQAFSDKVFRSLSGRNEADSSQTASPKGLLQAAFGRGPRGGAVNAKDAAERLGVSVGTVRRWAAGTQQPSREHLLSLRSAVRRVTSTKGGRKAATDAFRNSAAGKAAQRGDRIGMSVYAHQGPTIKSTGYSRDRTIFHRVEATDVEEMLRAYEERGSDGFRDWLCDMGNDYMNEGKYTGKDDIWEFGDIYDVRFEGREDE